MLKVLFITAGSHSPSDKNLNHFQRVYFISRYEELTVLSRKSSDFSDSAYEGTEVIRGLVSGKLGVLLEGILLAVTGRARRFDVVLTEPSTLAFCGLLCKLFCGCKWVVDIWDVPIRCFVGVSRPMLARRTVLRAFLKFIFRRADMFIVSMLPDFELKEFGLKWEKMLLLENAIWLDDLRKVDTEEKPPFRLLAMRSFFTRDMGLDVLGEAMEIVSGNSGEVRLSVVGKILKEVEPHVERLRANPNVELIEFMEHHELLKLIGGAAACIIPYREVPDLIQIYPVKVLEYLALGKPVIAPDTENMRRMLSDGWNALLYKPGDAKDLAEKVLMLHRDKEMRRKMGENAQNLDERFNCVHKNRLIINELHKLAAGER